MTEQIVQPLTQDEQLAALGRYEYGWADSDTAGSVAQRGLSEAVVRDSDRSDGKIAHLDGLNLSRAWALRSIARTIAPHPRLALLESLAQRHLDAALPHVAGDYMGEHWLASFALLALLAA